jgi:hypothetical protein
MKENRAEPWLCSITHPTIGLIHPPALVQLDTSIVGSTCLGVGGRVLVVVVTSQPVLVVYRRRRGGDRVIFPHIVYIVVGPYELSMGGTRGFGVVSVVDGRYVVLGMGMGG